MSGTIPVAFAVDAQATGIYCEIRGYYSQYKQWTNKDDKSHDDCFFLISFADLEGDTSHPSEEHNDSYSDQ